MRNSKLLLISLLASITILSCTWEVKTQSSSNLAYSGRIVFSDDKTRIVSISPKGFMTYETHGDKLRAENDLHGRIVYQVNGDSKAYSLSGKGQILLDKAVQQLVSDSTLKNKPYIINDTK